MRSSLTLLALLLAVTVALVAPTGCGCRLDLHGGQPLHLVLDHPHPDAPGETDGLAVTASGQPELHVGSVLFPTGPLALTGQVVPRVGLLPGSAQAVSRLACTSGAAPAGITSSPLDPPPELV